MNKFHKLAALNFALGIVFAVSSLTILNHYHRTQKSMGPIRAIACMQGDHYCWLRRANDEMFLANFVEDMTMLQGAVTVKDIIYVDRGWWFGIKYQQIVKIVPENK